MQTEMCKRTNINPWIQTNFIGTFVFNAWRCQGSTAGVTTPSAGEMRSTLLVVAALLATLTFVAGFTLLGGLD